MRVRLKERALTAAVVIATIGVIVFAVLQYRWSTEIIDATGVRMADTLQLSMVNWQIDFERNFSEITTTLRPDRADDAEALARRLAELRRIARYPDLVAALRVEDTWPPSPLDGARGVLSEVGGSGEWRFDPRDPALVFTLGPNAQLGVALDQAVIARKILPDLANRYFQGTDGLDYEVAVVSGMARRQVIYSSDPGFGDREVPDADGTLNIFGRSVRTGTTAPLSVFHRTFDRHQPVPAATLTWLPLASDADEADDWRLVVRHRRGGPLGAFVADMHQRDLVISFGALLLLVLSMGMLIVTSSRAQRLARLQMDFVTAVSHELRTPLTVISSAADNIAQGVVQGPDQLRQYGSVIRSQVGHLSGLVEEILLFAATRSRPQHLTLTPVDLPAAVSAALTATDELLRAAQFTVECHVPSDLPPVTGDLLAVSQVLQNLISNALKYGHDGRWLGIATRVVERAPGDREVQISVSDRGHGIAAEDLSHIFEPFYRSASARSAQIHGTGLGLTLAKRLAEAMHGDLTVASAAEAGAAFTLHLPVTPALTSTQTANVPTAAA